MLPLIIFISLAAIIVVLIELRERKRRNNPTVSATATPPADCCGTHLVCEKETLLNSNAQIVYYDDEELDSLSGIKAEDYTEQQIHIFREIFDTLPEDNVAGWARSLNLRNINLPSDIREEALMIIREQRQNRK